MEGQGFYSGILWYARITIILALIAVLAGVFSGSGEKLFVLGISGIISAIFPILVGGAFHSVQKRVARLEEEIEALRKGQSGPSRSMV